MRGLEKLRRLVGDNFVAGIALYTGERSYRLDNSMYVVPIDRLWTPAKSDFLELSTDSPKEVGGR
jgi:hypothetical protein